MANEVPSLDTAGWVSGTAQMADKLFAYWLASEHSQSNAYLGLVESFPYVLQQNPRDPNALADATRTSLSRAMTPHYDTVSCEVKVIPKAGDEGRWDVRIDLRLTKDGKQYTLASLVSTVNQTITSVKRLNTV